jgi:hypothetical protein
MKQMSKNKKEKGEKQHDIRLRHKPRDTLFGFTLQNERRMMEDENGKSHIALYNNRSH